MADPGFDTPFWQPALRDDAVWSGWAGLCSPDAPLGGGGFGRFSSSGPLGAMPPAALAHSAAPASRGITPERIAALAAAPSFGVANLPAVMRRMGWVKSAEVMDAWFAGAAKIMSATEKSARARDSAYPAAFRRTGMFSMDWILGFERAQRACDTLVAGLGQTGVADAVRTRVAEAVTRTGRMPARFTQNASNVLALQDHWRIDATWVGTDVGITGPLLDDLYGSLGNFALIAAILDASIEPAAAGRPAQAVVRSVGVYMRDTFEFLGAQYLGHWNENGMGLVPAAALNARYGSDPEWHTSGWSPSLGWMTPINNSDFDRWRADHQQGGDLLLLSDVRPFAVNLRVPLP